MNLKSFIFLLFILLLFSSCGENKKKPQQDHSISMMETFSSKIKKRFGGFRHLSVGPPEGGKERKVSVEYKKDIGVYTDSVVVEMVKMIFEDTRNDSIDFLHLALESTFMSPDSLFKKSKKVKYTFPNTKPIKIELIPLNQKGEFRYIQRSKGQRTEKDKTSLLLGIHIFNDVENLDEEILKIKDLYTEEIREKSLDGINITIDLDHKLHYRSVNPDQQYVTKYQYKYYFRE